MEVTLSNPHPVQTLQENLQAARLTAIEALAATDGAYSIDALRELAALQTALTAVREEIEAHAGRLGWGSGTELK